MNRFDHQNICKLKSVSLPKTGNPTDIVKIAMDAHVSFTNKQKDAYVL